MIMTADLSAPVAAGRDRDACWKRFEAWQRRYRARYQAVIARAADEGAFLEDDPLFVQRWHELWQDPTSMVGDPYAELMQRIDERIAFIRAYLAYISFDGAGFMGRKMDFLSCLYPRRCHGAWGLWLVQDHQRPAPGASFHFQGSEMALFCHSLDQLDFAAAWQIMPFQSLLLRHPRGEDWQPRAITSTIAAIKHDLEHDRDLAALSLEQCQGSELWLSLPD